ncbi:MAG: glycerol kinase GlpK [Armatimonadetes bacterium]|nr:glycerol kinase GlpK [Armatimonadota bacterium]MDE2207545.1 glycerol kinase GlpK [Armatimonadota bacterium]
MGDLILALDAGTTSARAMVMDSDMRVLGSSASELRLSCPEPGWVEQDPEEIWQAQRAVMQGALQAARRSAADLACIGIANQRETTVLWERRTGVPMGPAIVWQDRRTAGRCDELRAMGCLVDVVERTGLTLDPYFSATKLAWMLDRSADIRQAAERGDLAFGTIDSWLIWKLTNGGCHVTDTSNASRTLLFNIRTLSWDPRLLALFGIPPALLPKVVASSGHAAETSAEHLGRRIPITGVAGDQQAAAFGQACIRPGTAKNTYGTGAFLLMNTGAAPAESKHGLLSTVGWTIGRDTTMALEGSVFTAGAAVQWLRDGLGIIGAASDVEALAASAPNSGGVTFVPAFTGLGAPYWDPYARGAITGITRATTAAHLAFAALEAVCVQTCEVVEAAQKDTGLKLPELRADGGMARNNLLMQMQADLLGVPVTCPENCETTAAGAAGLAGIAAGVWPDIDAFARGRRHQRRFEPVKPDRWREDVMSRWRESVARCRHHPSKPEG